MSSVAKYNVEKIAEICGGEIHGKLNDSQITHLAIDSRKINFPDQSIFIAIKGANHNGHQFIPQVFENGVTTFMVNKTEVNELKNKFGADACFISVDDSLEALHQLTSKHRRLFDIPIVGIAGSNGKTIVKEWVHHLLADQFHICKNPKSYNSQVGVPLSVWNLSAEHHIGVFEAGISQPNEMEKLAEILKPSIGLFTNIGSAHDEGFENMGQKIQEKIKLFAETDTIITSADHVSIIQALKEAYPDKQLYTWGIENAADATCSVKERDGFTTITIKTENVAFEFEIPFTDTASTENAINALMIALKLGASIDQAISKTKSLPEINMRHTFKRGKHNCFILDDSYSNDFDSLKIALDSLSGLKQYGKKTVIISDFEQTNIEPSKFLEELNEILSSKGISRLIVVGNQLKELKSLFKGESHFLADTNSLLESLDNIAFGSEAILIKGARSFQLEKVVKRLENKVHDTVLEIDLNAIVHNLNYYRNQLKPETKVMAMVKASGYGTGTHEIANILSFHHVDYLSVAYADEGIELRQKGIQLPIMVMNAENASIDMLIENKLEPVIYNLAGLDRLGASDKLSGIHLEFDTGMHRLGFAPEEIDAIISEIKKSGVRIKSVFSHLSSADDSNEDSFTTQQIQNFTAIASKIQETLGYKVIKHIANSAGTSRFGEAHFDMVRLGVGLYGVGVSTEEQKSLMPVVNLRSTVAQISEIKKGETVGYGRSFKATENMKIATIPIGYADGFRRDLGNGKGRMFVNGQPATVVGKVCMDMTMIDVSEMKVKLGDAVEVIGHNITLNDMAEMLGTIPYEILTSISPRVRRVYSQE